MCAPLAQFSLGSATITLPAAAAELPTPDYGSEIESLSQILERYQTWDDILSVDLFSWGTEVLQEVIKHKDDEPDKIAAIAQKHLQVLSNTILVNPLYDDSPLQDPVKERRWTWERGFHAEYRMLFRLSPLDGKQMSDDPPPPHLFAIEMMNWRDHLRTSYAILQRAEPMDHPLQEQRALVVHAARLGPFRIIFYQRLAQAAVARWQQKETGKELDYALVRLDQCQVQMLERNRQVLAETEARAAEHEAALQHQLEAIERTHQRTIEALSAQVADMQAQHQEHLAALEQRLSVVDQANAAEIELLTQQIASLKQEHQSAVGHLTDQIDKNNQRHRNEVSQLMGELQSAKRAHLEAVASLNETHQKAVAGLQTQIAEQDGALRREVAINAQQGQQIQALGGALGQAQAEISRLRNKDSCSIL